MNAVDATNASILHHDSTQVIFQSSLDEDQDIVKPAEKDGGKIIQSNSLNVMDKLKKSMQWNPDTLFNAGRIRKGSDMSSRNSSSTKKSHFTKVDAGKFNLRKHGLD